MEHVLEKKMGEYVGRIFLEEDCSFCDPREWDNLGTMACWHRNYSLGDKQASDSIELLDELAQEANPNFHCIEEYWNRGKGSTRIVNWHKNRGESSDYGDYWEEMENRVNDTRNKIIEKHYIILPLYLYDHSGITMNTGGFSCGWDSGQVGYIYVSKEKIRKEYNVKHISKKLREQVESILESEVKTYDLHIRGECYYFEIMKNGEAIDSCGGFLGLDACEEILEEALTACVEGKI